MKNAHKIFIATAIAAAITSPHAAAQDKWPNKPIRMTVSSGAGGGLDFVSRLVAQPLTEALGQSVVVDNRAGASGSIAAEVTARSAPDGYTVMMLSASLVVYGVVAKTPYDLYKDFDAVSQVAGGPYILSVHPSLPVKSVAELVAYAKANPAKLNFASTGNASLAHLAGELFGQSTGTKVTHVPYKGVGAALTDLLSGQVQFSFLSGGSIYNQVRSGKLRALGIASAKRVKVAPDIPTMIEAGVPGYLVTQWHGMVAPRGTPKPIIDRIYKEIVKAVQRPDVMTRLEQDGTDGVASSPQEFAAFLRSERDQWSRVVKSAGIKIESALPLSLLQKTMPPAGGIVVFSACLFQVPRPHSPQ
jgi:tripartite-type tricarboxylate transporter receptor subunit TctC